MRLLIATFLFALSYAQTEESLIFGLGEFLISGSSNSQRGNGFGALADGSLTTMWHAEDIASSAEWLQVQFPTPSVIREMKIVTADDDPSHGFQRLLILRSDNGDDWFTVRTEYFDASTCQSLRETTHNGWPESTSYIRIRLEVGCGPNYFALASWEIFGDSIPIESMPNDSKTIDFCVEAGCSFGCLGDDEFCDDRSGEVEAEMWDDPTRLQNFCSPDRISCSTTGNQITAAPNSEYPENYILSITESRLRMRSPTRADVQLSIQSTLPLPWCFQDRSWTTFELFWSDQNARGTSMIHLIDTTLTEEHCRQTWYLTIASDQICDSDIILNTMFEPAKDNDPHARWMIRKRTTMSMSEICVEGLQEPYWELIHSGSKCVYDTMREVVRVGIWAGHDYFEIADVDIISIEFDHNGTSVDFTNHISRIDSTYDQPLLNFTNEVDTGAILGFGILLVPRFEFSNHLIRLIHYKIKVQYTDGYEIAISDNDASHCSIMSANPTHSPAKLSVLFDGDEDSSDVDQIISARGYVLVFVFMCFAFLVTCRFLNSQKATATSDVQKPRKFKDGEMKRCPTDHGSTPSSPVFNRLPSNPSMTSVDGTSGPGPPTDNSNLEGEQNTALDDVDLEGFGSLNQIWYE